MGGRGSLAYGRVVGMGTSSRPRLRGRFRRKPLLLGVLAAGVVSLLLIVTLGARPTAEAVQAVPVEQAYVGTTYGFDGLVCLGSQLFPSTVDSVSVEQAEGTATQLVRAPDAAPTLGFPVADGGESVDGLVVAAGEKDCTLRLLVTPDRQGALRAGAVTVRLRYGPGGLLRRSATVRPAATLDVTGTGTDPRSS